MREVDIWIEVFKTIGLSIYGESTQPSLGNGVIFFKEYRDSEYTTEKICICEYSLWYKLDTGNVIKMYYCDFRGGDMSKDEFIKLNKDIFRNYKLSQLV